MKFIVSRTSDIASDESPCTEAKSTEVTTYTNCTCPTVDEAMKHDWVRAGNPVQMVGSVRVYHKDKKAVWTIDINSLEELTNFISKHGEIVIKDSISEDIPLTIEIYDDYRE